MTEPPTQPTPRSAWHRSATAMNTPLAAAAACAETTSLDRSPGGGGDADAGQFTGAAIRSAPLSAAIVDASGARAVYRKAHLWDGEKNIFTPGDGAPPVVALPFGNVGLMICYDLEFPEWVRLAALSGADLIAAPVNWPASASPAPPGERSGEVVSAQAAAWSNGVFIAVADRCGTERGVDWVGGSVIIGRGGYPAAGPVCEDRTAVLAAAIDLRLARDKRVSERNDLFTDRRPDLYARLWDAADPAATAAG